MKRLLCLISVILVFCSLSVSASSAKWRVILTADLDSYSDSFQAGAKEGANDAYDTQADILQPGGPPSGAYIQISSTVDGKSLTGDYRSDISVDETKVWEIRLIANDPEFQGISGSSVISWELENTGGLELELIDYGDDNSRQDLVDSISLTGEQSYEFQVDNVWGPYRFLDLVIKRIELTEEEGCVPDWTCLEWSSCSNNKQTRSCVDSNECGTDEGKPALSQSCGSQPSQTSGGGGSGPTICVPRWSCTDWSDCIDDQRTRECTDERSCNSDSSKPSEVQGCVSLKEEPNDEGVQEIQDKGEEGTNGESSLDVTREIMDRLNTESSPLGKITGAAVTDVSPQTNLIIGLSIIFGIVVAGVALYLFLFRKNA